MTRQIKAADALRLANTGHAANFFAPATEATTPKVVTSIATFTHSPSGIAAKPRSSGNAWHIFFFCSHAKEGIFRGDVKPSSQHTGEAQDGAYARQDKLTALETRTRKQTGDVRRNIHVFTPKCYTSDSAKTAETRHLRGQKRPLKPKEVWAVRVRLEIAVARRNLALFNLAIDSKLRACDLVTLKVEDVCLGRRVRDRAMIIQRKTGRQCSLSSPSQPVFPFRVGSKPWSYAADIFFPSRHHDSPHLSTRQYARIVDGWVKCAGLDPAAYGTHFMRRIKATQIYRKTGNLRAG